jgi:hypothetical protein
MVLSLRAMIVKFMVLMVIAAFCFCGFLYALWTYVSDIILVDEEVYSLSFCRLSRNQAGLVLSLPIITRNVDEVMFVT